MERKEIYITGAGIVSAIGIGKAETLDALMNRRTGVAPVRYLQTTHTGLPVGEVKFTDNELREMSQLMPSDAFIRSSLLAIPAVREAMEQARINRSAALRIAFLRGSPLEGWTKRSDTTPIFSRTILKIFISN